MAGRTCWEETRTAAPLSRYTTIQTKIAQFRGDNRTVEAGTLLDTSPPEGVPLGARIFATTTAPMNTIGRITAITTSQVGRSHEGRITVMMRTTTNVDASPTTTRPGQEAADWRRAGTG
jgi:hypothetical protein